jgi:hypothetical protein
MIHWEISQSPTFEAAPIDLRASTAIIWDDWEQCKTAVTRLLEISRDVSISDTQRVCDISVHFAQSEGDTPIKRSIQQSDQIAKGVQ